MTERDPSDRGLDAAIRLHHQIQQWLYREARLLDDERFQDWLALLAPEIHYWLPLRENRFRRDRRPAPTPATSASVFNDDFDDLALRIKRFDTGLVWSEDPAPRVCRSVSNVEVEEDDAAAGTLRVHSHVAILRSRRQDEEVTFTARREDRFRRIDGHWKLAQRHIYALHHVFLDENVSVFF
jgi:ethylbenzene dioxygenase subunit beta